MAVNLVRYLANLGYGSRREVKALLQDGHIRHRDGHVLTVTSSAEHADIRVHEQPLDPPPGMVIMLNKPLGMTCSHNDAGAIVYDLLPPRFLLRKPKLSSAGRLDKDTSGLLLLSDDGQLIHRLTSPKQGVSKTYIVTLARDLDGDEAAVFASGTLLLRQEKTPCKPAQLQMLDARTARVVIHEGRYHQVRRMFAAVGNHVAALRREAMGCLMLDASLAPGAWRLLHPHELDAVFKAPDAGTAHPDAR